MGTYEDLAVGDRFHTPARTLDEETVRGVIGLGGFTHPLFVDPAFAAASGFGRTPVPGQAILLMMGGLVEQTGRFDGSAILTGFDAVRFLRPVFAGDTVRTEVEVVAKEPTPSGASGVIVMAWHCVKDTGERVTDATVRMLLNRVRRA